MIAPSLTSAARLPRRSSLSRSPTLWSAPDATTIRYDRLPRLTSTIIWIFLTIRPGRVSRRPTRLPGFQGSEIGLVVAADLLESVAAELLQEGTGQDDGHHRLAHDASGRDGAGVAPLDHGLHRLLGCEIDRSQRRPERRERLHRRPGDHRLAVGHAALPAARVVRRAPEPAVVVEQDLVVHSRARPARGFEAETELAALDRLDRADGLGEAAVARSSDLLLGDARFGWADRDRRLSVLAVAVRDLERDGTAERGSPPHAREDVDRVALDLHAAAAPVAALAARQVLVDVALGQRQARREAVDDRHEGLTVGPARGKEPKHPAHGDYFTLLLRGRGRRWGLRRVDLQDRRRDEHDELAARGLRGRRLEQPSEDGNVAEQRKLPHLVGIEVRRHAADDQTLAFLDENLGLRLTLVDDRRGPRGGAEVDGRVASRVVLDRDLHLDLGDVAFPNDGRDDVEPEHGFLELDLRTGGADRRVRNFFAEGDRGGPVLDGDDLGARERPCLAEQAQRLEREVDVVPATGEAERDTAGATARDRAAAECGADGQVDEVPAKGQTGRAADREQVWEAGGGVRGTEHVGHGDAAREPEIVGGVTGEPAADEDRVPTGLDDTAAAPLDADGEQVIAIEDLHARLDLHLRQRHVELLPDQRLDTLEIRLVVAYEDRVRGLVGANRDALRQHLGGRRRRRGLGDLGRGTVERGERRRRDGGEPLRHRRHLGLDAGGRNSEDPLQGPCDLLGIGVGEPNRLFAQRSAGAELGDRLVGEALLVDGLLLLELGLGDLRPDVALGLHARFFDSRGRLAFLDQLLVGDDAEHAVLLDLAQTAGLEDGVERQIPGDVLQGDRHLPLDVVADDDVLVALGGQDAEEVHDVRVLEVERDEALAVGRRRRGGRRRGLSDLHRARGLSGRRFLCAGPGGRCGAARDRGRRSRRGNDDRQTIGLLADRVADAAAQVEHETRDALPVLAAANLLDRILPDVQRRLAPRVYRVLQVDDEPAGRIHQIGLVLRLSRRLHEHGDGVRMRRHRHIAEPRRLSLGPRTRRDQEHQREAHDDQHDGDPSFSVHLVCRQSENHAV